MLVNHLGGLFFFEETGVIARLTCPKLQIGQPKMGGTCE